MQNWINKKQKESVDKSVKFFDSLDKKQRVYFYDMFSDNKLKSHINVLENGCAYISSSDEYSPFDSGDYIVYSFKENGIQMQIAWSKFYKEIYVSGYVPAKNGWYEWREYHRDLEPFTNKVMPKMKKKKISFEEALQEAKERVAVTKNGKSSQNDDYKLNKNRKLQEERVNAGYRFFLKVKTAALIIE